MLSFPTTYNAPPDQSREQSSLPRRTDSLSSSVVKPKPISPIVQSTEDLKFAKIVLATPTAAEGDEDLGAEEREQRREERERELTEMLARMTGWVEELSSLLQQAYKNQTDLETALTLTRSNLQLALANNEMLEEALKRGGKDVGWRRWSDREGVRRTGSVKEYTQQDRPNSVAEVPPNPSPPQAQQSGASRFFNFKSPLQRVSSASTSPTSTQSPPASTSHTPSSSYSQPHSVSASSPALLPSVSIPSRSQTPAPNGASDPSRPPSPPSPSEREKDLSLMLQKERVAIQKITKEKAELEEELESLSQALFEEANKMVSKANRKLAETEEELRVAMAQKEALKSALVIVEGENGQLRGDARPVFVGDARGDSGSMERGRQQERSRPGPDRKDSSHDPDPDPDAPDPTTPLPTQTVSSTDTDTDIPTVTVTGGPESFWSPVTPGPDAMTPTVTKSGHRWSVLPRTPRSRSAVRSEFEEAMRRMHDIVGEGDEEDGTGAGAGLRADDNHPKPGGKREDGEGEEPVSPRIEFAARRSPGSEGEPEVEDEVKVRENPWTS